MCVIRPAKKVGLLVQMDVFWATQDTLRDLEGASARMSWWGWMCLRDLPQHWAVIGVSWDLLYAPTSTSCTTKTQFRLGNIH